MQKWRCICTFASCLQVIWVRFKAGTLPQLLNQSTVPLVPKWNVHVTEHYLIVVIEGYIISAALELVIFLTVDNKQHENGPATRYTVFAFHACGKKRMCYARETNETYMRSKRFQASPLRACSNFAGEGSAKNGEALGRITT